MTELSDKERREAVIRDLMKERTALFSFILSLVRNPDLAEEALQETALVACEQWADFVPGTDFGAWMRSIARNKIYSLNRKRGREVPLDPETIDSIDRAFSEEADPAWVNALSRCLGKMNDRSRRILALKYQDCLGGRQIAERLKTSVEAIHMSLSRARAALADCVASRLARKEIG